MATATTAQLQAAANKLATVNSSYKNMTATQIIAASKNNPAIATQLQNYLPSGVTTGTGLISASTKPAVTAPSAADLAAQKAAAAKAALEKTYWPKSVRRRVYHSSTCTCNRPKMQV